MSATRRGLEVGQHELFQIDRRLRQVRVEQRTCAPDQEATVPLMTRIGDDLHPCREMSELIRGSGDPPVLGEEVVQLAAETEAAVADDREVVTDPGQLADQVRRQDHGHPGCRRAVDEVLQEGASGEWVEGRQRLVEQQDPRTLRHCEG